jgi:hypothetical protein
MVANPRTSGAITEYVIAEKVSRERVRLQGWLTNDSDIGIDWKHATP